MSTVRRTFDRIGNRDVRRRLADLEAGLQEQRQLSRRLAELTDLVTDLLLPLADRDQDTVDALVDRYRASL